jgi:hypothetical protein
MLSLRTLSQVLVLLTLTLTSRASKKIMLFFLKGLACVLVRDAHGSFVIQENSVLIPSSSNYHAYENSWSTVFDNVDAVDFDILIFEVCSEQPCPSQLEKFSELVDCDGLIEHFNESAWYNQYVSRQIQSSSTSLCNDMHSNPDQVQMVSNVIIRDERERSLVSLRQPLALDILNDESMLSAWGNQINATDIGIDTSRPVYEIVLRVTQVLNLQRVFAIHQSLVRVILVTPTLNSMSFSVQNPCTARGYSAPKFGGVTQREADQRERCMWTCRVDLWRQPYNSVPPTRAQLNSSHPDFAALDPKYSCLPIPKNWAAVFFGFEIETHMIATSTSYTQVLYDALDQMARGIEKDFESRGIAVVVSLAVPHSLYHPQRFREELQEKAEATCLLTQCENRWYPDTQGWVNKHFLYADARRRLGRENKNKGTEYMHHTRFPSLGNGSFGTPFELECSTWRSAAGAATQASTSLPGQRRRTMSVHSLNVDGVIVSDDIDSLTDDRQRLQTITNLRDSVYSQGRLLNSFSNSLQISRVEDFDIASVVGFVDERVIPKPPLNSANYMPHAYIIIILSIAMIVVGVMCLVCVLLTREVLEYPRRRHEYDPAPS